MRETQDQGVKIVMIGRTKAGKSATGNILLGRIVFKSVISTSSVTQECQIGRGTPEEQSLTVIDTPGLFGGTTSDSSDPPEKVMEAIKECMQLAPPGPVVYLVVLQLGTLTEREQQTVKIIQRSFGREAAHYTVALFTRGDDLRNAGDTIEEYIGANPDTRDFIRECLGGYQVFDNEDVNSPQVTELLRKITAIVQRNGGGRAEIHQEGEGVLHQENLRGKENETGKDLMLACLDGASGGVFLITCGALYFGDLKPKDLLEIAVFTGMIGAVGGAARFTVGRLIWRR
ncbi:GTPase IMAP family member 7-like isoform X2 [Notolabrus celidotus]|uniref:GTPase IMAP family member 7-like isoform X2 n=1 Tax=Notolabrus celidotus TaxID=1203425 RepID=UPI00148FF156|nr:GTPase IMAP family member 7-like isoform X2 [Notolabrus celidotus]